MDAQRVKGEDVTKACVVNVHSPTRFEIRYPYSKKSYPFKVLVANFQLAQPISNRFGHPDFSSKIDFTIFI